jgi:hypothetical protein
MKTHFSPIAHIVFCRAGAIRRQHTTKGRLRPPSRVGRRRRRRSGHRWRQLPTASVTHFFVKLVLAAPASFFSAADISQDFAASD